MKGPKRANGLDNSHDVKTKTDEQKAADPKKIKPPLTPNKGYPASDQDDWT